MHRLILVAVVAAASVAALSLWPTEARAVRRTLDAAAEAASVPAGEGNLQRVARAAGLAKRLTRDVLVQADPDGGPSLRGRDTVAALAARLRSSGAVTISIASAEIAVDRAAGRATARVIADVSSIEREADRGGGGGGAGSFGALDLAGGAELSIELAKIDGDWLIARVTRIPDLRR